MSKTLDALNSWHRSIHTALAAFDFGKAADELRQAGVLWGWPPAESYPTPDALRDLARHLLTMAAMHGRSSSGGLRAERKCDGERVSLALLMDC